MFTGCLLSPRSNLGLYLVTRRNHGKRFIFLWQRAAAVLLFPRQESQVLKNKGVNIVPFCIRLDIYSVP